MAGELARDPVAAAYAELLAREPWHWFVTLTFAVDHQRASGGMHPEKAEKAFRYFVSHLNESIYGGNWRRKAHGGVVWARGHELHKDGRSHFHAVMAAPQGDLNKLASRYYWHEWWYREFGRNQIERPKDQDDVVGYVSKYVTKDGEVDFSANFGEARPEPLFSPERLAGVAIPAAAAEQKFVAVEPARTRRRGTVLSLTPPVRPLHAQHCFSEESFYEPPQPDDRPTKTED